MKKVFKLYILTVVLLSNFSVFAQPGDDDGGGGLEGGDPNPAPINSALIYLLIFGVLFAMYTIKKNRKTT